MAKSAALTLYGVKNPVMTSKDGSFQALPWSELRAAGHWGELKDEDGGNIIWFDEVGAREDFFAIFGGETRVTLHRRGTTTHIGTAAAALLRQVNAKRGAA